MPSLILSQYCTSILIVFGRSLICVGLMKTGDVLFKMVVVFKGDNCNDIMKNNRNACPDISKAISFKLGVLAINLKHLSFVPA